MSDRIIDFKIIGTVKDIQGKGWTFDQSEDSNKITKDNLNCDPELKEDFDTFFHNENDEILCMSDTIPTYDKYVWEPIYEESP